MKKAVLVLFVVLASAAAAQPTPQPPFPEPLAGVVGRYGPTPAAGASYASSGLGVVLFVRDFGRTVDIYRLTTFPSRVAVANGQKVTPDAVIDPSAPGSGWSALANGGTRVDNIVFDHRGYLIVSFDNIGTGILDTSGHLIKELQGTFGPVVVFENGGRSYLIAQTVAATIIYDITDPAAPVVAQTLPFRVIAAAEANGRLAVSVGDGHELRFYTPSALLSLGAPLQTIGPGNERFALLATNGTDFFTESVIDGSDTTTITSLFTATGGTYTRTSQIPIANMFRIQLRYEAGYLVLAGYRSDNSTAPGGAIFTIDGQTLVHHDIRPFIEQTYGPPNGGAEFSLTPFSTGGRTYLAADMYVASDLFIFQDPNAIPTMSTWALIALATVLGAVALMRMRG
ncbi:MAG TPA: IPTL-CTERM sorting domain-containing protein [Thermoanaerobaculia bacterium]|nr:IPTL-CTERM sorting domain-containing protein [Thermoanaerobaculia bacterium]